MSEHEPIKTENKAEPLKELRFEDFDQIRNQILSGELSPDTAADLVNLQKHTKECRSQLEQKYEELMAQLSTTQDSAKRDKIAGILSDMNTKHDDLGNRIGVLDMLVEEATKRGLVSENIGPDKEVGIGTPEVSKCPQCGNPLSPDQNFCTNCGYKVNRESNPATDEYDEWEKLKFETQYKKEHEQPVDEQAQKRLDQLNKSFGSAAHSGDYKISSQLHLKETEMQ